MKIFNNIPLAVLAIALTCVLAGQNAYAATTPSLGVAEGYGIVSTTYTNSLNAGLETAIVGDICYTTPPATAPISISGTTDVPCSAGVGTAQSTALADLDSQTAGCTDLGVNVVLSGTYTPGCYTSTGTMDITLSTTVTLDGAGTYIFRPGGAFTTGANSKVVLTGGASACDVFWTLGGGAVTIGANSSTSATPTFVGNIIVDELSSFGINLGHFVNLTGRLLAFGHTVTTDSNTITVPTCAAAPATLHVIKTVVNDDGGFATASGFSMHVKTGGVDVAGSPVVGAVTPGTSFSLVAGTYVVSEDANALYTQSFSGDCDASGNITLAPDDDKTCTITNNDVAPAPATINVVKIMVNDNGRTKTVADFPLFVSGTPVVSGATNTFAAPATYTVTETSDSNYVRTFSGDCDASGNVTLAPGDSKFCVVTNDDLPLPVVTPATGGGGSASGHSASPTTPPIIDVVKVPSPLNLPGGPGSVKYTYTLTNIGTVPVAYIDMVDDSCQPISLISGDTNSDATLAVNETWIFTCSTTLSETHTNNVTASGWANGISAVDIASATVVVGASVPPLIHVTKVPTPLTLPAGGGAVTYNFKVTTPGTVALNNINVTDDKCNSVKYLSGDTNENSMLDTNELWRYSCKANLTKTTTNTVTASGEANGIRVKDIAIVTVPVATALATAAAPIVPGLPNTGVVPFESLLMFSITAIGIFLASIITLAILRKKIL